MNMFSLTNRLKWVGLISILAIFNLIWLLLNKDYNTKYRSHTETMKTKFLRNWEDHNLIKVALYRKGPGELGSPVSIEEYRKQLYDAYGYDAILSDQISVNRSVPDTRPGDCRLLAYNDQLPKAAVIIIFFNERLSVLLRTVHGVLNRTPDELIQEIILVDDCSTYAELRCPLMSHLRNFLPEKRSKVRLIRLPVRTGLMSARMAGARATSKESKVLIFIDAHFEVNYNWLPPLLEPIARNPKVCTCPSLDHISSESLQYTKKSPFRGYFDWTLNYKFLELEPEEYAAPATNFREYVLMGAAIAIGAEFFWELGGFDEGMTLWGGEQFELSFKIWMCGGEILQVPCSRMAHLFRDANTKASANVYGNYSFVNKNYRRLVDVWMDKKHRQYVFNRRPILKTTDPGDLTERFAIRDGLRCKSFSWMLATIMPDLKEKFPPIEPGDLAEGNVQSIYDPSSCIAITYDKKVVLRTCSNGNNVATSMHWAYAWDGHIKRNGSCLESDLWNGQVRSWNCITRRSNQQWYYDREQLWIAQVERNLCMTASLKDKLIKLDNCDSENMAMKWNITNINQNQMNKWDSKLRWRF